MPFQSVNTANTLSVNFRPGQDIRTPATSSSSVFTFGNFRYETQSNLDILSSDTRSSLFDGYQNLTSLNMSGVTKPRAVFVSSSDLKVKKGEASGFVYFGTLKKEVAVAISRIIDMWPYGVVSTSINSTGITGYDYSAITSDVSNYTSSIKIPFSAASNQGGVILNSGSTRLGRSILTNTSDFVVQLCGSSVTHEIISYSFSAGSYLDFTLKGILLAGQTTGDTTRHIFIRPNDKIFSNFKSSLSPLERHLVYNGTFLYPNPFYNDGTEYERTFSWPKSIDGFNLDTFGNSYDSYVNELLQFSKELDEEKTDVLIRHVIPENYLELDSENNIYENVVQSFAHQFDEIKRFIDGIAFAHTVTYDGNNNIPDKFLAKLSDLLGMELPSNFSELDFFEYLSSNVGDTQNTRQYYDIEVWRRVLINIIWLFKAKGTRDALQFIFKLIGAPDSIVRLNEFIYEIEGAIDIVNSSLSGSTAQSSTLSRKIRDNGYIEYNASKYVFQEGGKGRGNGRRYIDQWEPEFSPKIKIDNYKSETGNTVVFGTQNKVNTKELDCALDPAQAIEGSVQEFYQLSGTCWVWGSEDPFYFSGLTVPFEYVIENCAAVAHESISGMTIYEYIDFVYSGNVNPRNRKTLGLSHNSFHYPELRKIYLSYYYMTSPSSDQLTFKKLEKFLELIEMNFFGYSEKLIPATSILKTYGTVYRNTVFNRQKHVYKRGINDGSEFTNELLNIKPTGITITTNCVVDDIIQPEIKPIVINSEIDMAITCSHTPINMSIYVEEEIVNILDAMHVDATIEITDSMEQEIEITETD